MATSSKRFMIILVLTYILLGMLFMMTGGGEVQPNTQMSIHVDGLQDAGIEGTDTFGEQNLDESQTVIDKVFGNSIGYGRFLFTIFTGQYTTGLMNSINEREDIACPDCPDPTTVGILGLFLALYFTIIHILAGIEFYYIIINKKND